MKLTEVSDHDTLAAYVELADFAWQTLALARERDWQSLAAQQACEVDLLARLQSFAEPLSRNVDTREQQARLIHQILAVHAQTEVLLRPWRNEIAAELQCVDSSRRLARAYIAQPGGF